jgi:hypothetical protein
MLGKLCSREYLIYAGRLVEIHLVLAVPKTKMYIHIGSQFSIQQVLYYTIPNSSNFVIRIYIYIYIYMTVMYMYIQIQHNTVTVVYLTLNFHLTGVSTAY